MDSLQIRNTAEDRAAVSIHYTVRSSRVVLHLDTTREARRSVDADSGAILGSIPDLKRVHGIALVPDLGRGFISDGGADEAVVFDLKTLKVTGHIKTGGNPDCIFYEPASKHIFTMNGKSNDATVIDPATATVVATFQWAAAPSTPWLTARG